MTEGKGRQIAALLLAGVVAFVVTSLVTYSSSDYAANVFPHDSGQRIQNRCGVIGAFLSFHAFLWFGAAAYVLLALVLAWSALLFFRAPLSDVPSRVFGSALLVLSTAALASMAFEGPSATWPSPGGVLGIGVAEFLQGKFSRVGTYLVLSVVGILSLVLATDSLLFALAGRAATAASTSMSLAASRLATRWEAWLSVRRQEADRRRAEREGVLEAERARQVEAEAQARAGVEQELAQLAAQRERLREERERSKEDEATRREEERLRKEEERIRSEEEKARKKAERAAARDPESGAVQKATRKLTKMLGLSGEALAPAAPENGRASTQRFEGLRVAPPTNGVYTLPPLMLLEDAERVDPARGQIHAQEKARILEQTLESFRIDGKVVHMERGPIVTQYEIEILAGTKVSAVTALSNDLAMALKAPSIRIQAPIPGKGTIGIEVPNVEKEVVRVKDLITGTDVRRMKIPLYLGKMADGQPLVPDLVKMPHLLIAGTTGSGKSVCINTIVSSILVCRTPEEIKLVLIDPKMVELAGYKNLPHLLTPVVTEMNRASAVLDWAVEKMEERYRILKDVGCRQLSEYNEMSPEERRRRLEARDEDPAAYPDILPYIVIIIDELADLMMVARKEVETSIIRIAQKSRAVGIHLILATQRPSADVITGLIKSNLPSRIAFRVNAKQDSRIILDFNGAEKLLGGGDMLFLTPGPPQPVRCQGAYMSDQEIRGLIQWVCGQASPEFSTELDQVKNTGDIDPSQADDLFDEAVRIILETQRGSATLLQRRLEVGYSRASRLIDMMEEVGIVGPHRGSKSRDILLTLEEWESQRAPAGEGN